MSTSAEQALRDAIDRNGPAVLLMRADAPGDAKRTRFLGQSSDGIWIESPARQQLLAEHLQRSGKTVKVSFRSGEYVVSFNTTVRSYRARYELSTAVIAEAICLAVPTDISMTQRRAGYRAKVALNAEIQAAAWIVDETASIELPPPEPGIVADLRDLSVNGMGLILRSSKGKSPKVELGDRVRVELTHDGRQLTVGARVRQEPRRLPDGSTRIGLNLEGLNMTIAGRRTSCQIAQLVAELQRAEARRRRAG